MSRSPAGEVIAAELADGSTSYKLRFQVNGKRPCWKLGTSAEGWTPRKAEEERAATAVAIRKGTWEPPRSTPSLPQGQVEPTFHEFASEWFQANELRWVEGTRTNYRWQLSSHLLPFFKDHLLRQITVAEVDRYREAKQREGDLNADTINRTLTRLGQILDVADERELIDRNPLRVNPRRRKLRVPKRRPIYLDSADHILAVLDAAAILDADPNARTAGRRAFMAILAFAGLRPTEACELKRHHLNLPAGRIEVRGRKTDAADRDVDLLPVLRDELDAYLAGRGEVGPNEPLLPTARRTHREVNNLRERVVNPVVKEARPLALERTGRPLPDKLPPYKFRHTFCSLLLVHNPDPAYTMSQMGHRDPTFTLSVYTHLMRRSSGEREALKALIEGGRHEDMTSSMPQGPKLGLAQAVVETHA